MFLGMQHPTTTKEAPVYTTPNQDSRVGRMLAGLIQSTNKRAQLQLTVAITKQAGGHYHQAFRVKAWDSKREGVRMLTLDLNDGDYMAGTWATKVAHVNLGTGELKAAKGMEDKALLYAAFAAVHYMFTGSNPQPGNATVDVQEAGICGSCGATLTHDVSINLGIGPECAKRLGLEHHYKGTTLTGRAKRANKKQQAAAPEAAPAAPAAAAQAQQAAAAAGRTPAYVSGDDPRAQCEHGATSALDCVHCHRAYMQTIDADIARTQHQANAAGSNDAAEQYLDRLDTLRGMRSKHVAEWDGNHSLEAWERRVQAHPLASQLPRNDQVVLARWCYTNQTSIEENMAQMGMAPAAA